MNVLFPLLLAPENTVKGAKESSVLLRIDLKLVIFQLVITFLVLSER